MKKLSIRLMLIAFALSPVAATQAETSNWYVAPSFVYTDDDTERNIDDMVGGGQINVGRVITDRLNVEGSLGYSWLSGWDNGGLQVPDEKHLDLSANLLFFPNRGRAFTPFITIGFGYLGVEYETSGDENRPSATAGVGFLWHLGESRYAVRGEYRARLAYESGNNLTDMIGTLGVQYSFGGERPAKPKTRGFDTDGDGVIDHWDQCPRTPQGTEVDENGCTIERFEREADSDGDGVVDSVDDCPNTPASQPVDPRGCTLDRDDDADGVIDDLDACLETRRGARVDMRGCEIKDVIQLPGVNFETGSDRLVSTAEALVEQAAATLNRYPELTVEVAGHTDSVGSIEANESLSERRAATVYDFLIRFGVDASRLSSRGYGERQPIASNETADGRAINRRVELRIVKSE